MITQEQRQQVLDFVVSRQIPVDLALEIQDHMLEQIENSNIKEQDFDAAFNTAKQSWASDLALKYNWPTLVKKPKILIASGRKVQKEIYLESLKYFLPWVALTAVMTLYFPAMYSKILLGMYISMVAVYVVLYYKNSKLIKTAGGRYKGKISIYQGGTFTFTISSIYIVFFNLMNYTEKYGEFRNSLVEVFINHKMHQHEFGSIMMEISWVWGWIVGLLYLQKYKKAVAIIEDKITLNY